MSTKQMRAKLQTSLPPWLDSGCLQQRCLEMQPAQGSHQQGALPFLQTWNTACTCSCSQCSCTWIRLPSLSSSTSLPRTAAAVKMAVAAVCSRSKPTHPQVGLRLQLLLT